MLPRCTCSAVHVTPFQSVAMQPFEIARAGFANELLPNAMLVKGLGNGLLSVGKTPDPAITGRGEVTFVTVPVQSNSQQRLLPILAQTGAPELVFRVHSYGV